jgi:hypothetical protein
MSAVTYLSTDLQRRYRTVLDEARAGEARVRDSDGTNILLLPEATVQALRRVSAAAANLAAVEQVLEVMATRRATVSEFGDWSWLRAFDTADLREFVRDMREAIVVAARESSTALLDEQLRAWRITAEQAGDPLFRAILLGGAAEADFVEVRRPGLDESAVDKRVVASAEGSAE